MPKEAVAVEEAVEGEEAQVVPVTEIRALFVSRSEVEWVDVPGQAGCKVALVPMSPARRRDYLSDGQRVRVSAGKAEPVGDVQPDMAKQDLTLLLESVVDWQLLRQKPVKGSPGEFVTELTPAPKSAEQRRQMIRMWYEGSGAEMWSEEFTAWLVEECRRVNRLRVVDLGNWTSSSGS